MVDFTLNAQVCPDLGKGAGRRLRRSAGLVPVVVYGGDKEPQSVTLELREIAKFLENEAALSHVIALNVGGAKETVPIKALQRHPAKGFVMHADFLRVVTDHELITHILPHFINEEVAVGVKQSGGRISHIISEVEVSCLPKDLPEFIEVDMAKVELGQIVRLLDFRAPKGAELVQLAHGNDLAVANIHASRVVKEEGSEESVAEQFITRSPFYREGLPS